MGNRRSLPGYRGNMGELAIDKGGVRGKGLTGDDQDSKLWNESCDPVGEFGSEVSTTGSNPSDVEIDFDCGEVSKVNCGGAMIERFA